MFELFCTLAVIVFKIRIFVFQTTITGPCNNVETIQTICRYLLRLRATITKNNLLCWVLLIAALSAVEIKGKNVYFHSVVQFELIWTSIWYGWLDVNAMLGCNHVSSSEMPAKCLNKIFAILLYRPISKPEFPPRKGIVLNFSLCISLSLKIIRLLKNWLFVHDQKLSEGAF